MRRAAFNELREMVLWHTRVRLRGNILSGLRVQQGPAKGEKLTLKRPNYLHVLASEAWEGHARGIERFLKNVGMAPTPENISAAAERFIILRDPQSPKAYRWQYWRSTDAKRWLEKQMGYGTEVKWEAMYSELLEWAVHNEENPLEDFILREEAARALSPGEFEVLELYHGKGLPVNQIAAIRGTSPKTVYNQKENAERKLRELRELSEQVS